MAQLPHARRNERVRLAPARDTSNTSQTRSSALDDRGCRPEINEESVDCTWAEPLPQAPLSYFWQFSAPFHWPPAARRWSSGSTAYFISALSTRRRATSRRAFAIFRAYLTKRRGSLDFASGALLARAPFFISRTVSLNGERAGAVSSDGALARKAVARYTKILTDSVPAFERLLHWLFHIGNRARFLLNL